MILIRLPYVWVILFSISSAAVSLVISTALGYAFYFEIIISTNCKVTIAIIYPTILAPVILLASYMHIATCYN